MMAAHNDATSGTENTYHHEFNNTNESDSELLDPEPPSHSFDDQKKIRNWITFEDELEKESIGVNAAAHLKHKDNPAASPSSVIDFSRTYNDARHYTGRRHESPAPPYPAEPYPCQPARSDRANISYEPHLPSRHKVLSDTREGHLKPPQRIVASDSVAIDKPLNGPQDVSSHFALSLMVALCCCLPIGLIAIAFSKRTSVMLAKGNYRDAKTNSKRALCLNICGIVLGIIFAGIFIHLHISEKERHRNRT
ncbi:unnamed protein product [Lymnaea stagnalis]|uniref:Uncharacterized protein n=1 Tax=Lymnaea stagnalis TaxID=6523 RepID=A0AAV2HB43_LYMST